MKMLKSCFLLLLQESKKILLWQRFERIKVTRSTKEQKIIFLFDDDHLFHDFNCHHRRRHRQGPRLVFKQKIYLIERKLNARETDREGV